MTTHRCGTRHRTARALLECERPNWVVSGTGHWLMLDCSDTARMESNIADALLAVQEPCGPRCLDPWLHGLLLVSLEGQRIMIVAIEPLTLSFEPLEA